MSSKPTLVADGVVVGIHYTLKNDAGETLDSSIGQTPLEYLHGAGSLVVGLEEALTGKKLGESCQVVVPPETGYGERDPRGVRRVPRNAFPDDLELAEGMHFQTEDPNGEPMQVWIAAVEPDGVVIDLNHPLAGATLHFEVKIESLRDASAEELAHGHPHGPGGHHHH